MGRRRRKKRSFRSGLRRFFFGEIPGLTQLTFPLGAGGRIPAIGGAISSARKGRVGKEVLPFVRKANVILGKGFKGVGRFLGESTGVLPTRFRTTKLVLTGLGISAARVSPKFRKSLANIPGTIKTGGEFLGEQFESGAGFTGFTPFGTLLGGALGGAGLAGLFGAFRRRGREGRAGRDAPITIVGGAIPGAPEFQTSPLAPQFPVVNGAIEVPGAIEEPKVKAKPRARKAKVLKTDITINNVIQNQLLG